MLRSIILPTLIFVSASVPLMADEAFDVEKLTELASIKVETVQVDANGLVTREGDENWVTDGQLYPLLQGKYLVLQAQDSLDKGSCSNATGCSENKYFSTASIVAPIGWGFSEQTISVSQSGHGKNGIGFDAGQPDYQLQSVGGLLNIVTGASVRHYCHRAGGWRKGGCESHVSLTAVAVRYVK